MSKSSELDREIKIYILSCVEFDSEGNTLEKMDDKINYIKNRFYHEFNFRINRIGKMKAMEEWLQGLALNIAFTNFDIINLAIEWGSLSENHQEKEEYKIIENYFNFMADKTLQLINDYRLPKN